MQVYRGFEQFHPPPEGTVVTIGNFDGVHRGHAHIVQLTGQVAKRMGAAGLVVTFEPHPLAVLAPERAPERLITAGEKLLLLERCGATLCIVLRSEPALLTQTAEDFLARLAAHCRPRALVEGPDFNFGRGRTGSVATLREHAAQWGYEVHVADALHGTSLPTHPRISSSSIRQALRDGRVTEANAMLGRPYRIVGCVGRGAGRGARLGFPTANLEGVPHLLPQHAVYAGVAQLADGTLRPAAVNIGLQPTFADAHLRVEAHVLGHEGDLRGQSLGLHFLTRLREQTQFGGPDELADQVRRDAAEVLELAPQVESAVALPLEVLGGESGAGGD